MEAMKKLNEAQEQCGRTLSILKAASIPLAVMLQNWKTLVVLPDDKDMMDIGWGLEYALADAEKAQLVEAKATQEYYEAKIEALSNQIRKQP